MFIGIFIFMIINVSNNAHHDVRTIEPAGSLYSQTSKRASFDDYFKDWVKHRAADIKADSTGVYPVYIVAAEGGGSRAGFWTSYVLSKLQDETDGKLSNHIFGMTGASGGQVGMTMFNTMLKADYERGLNVKSYCEVPEKVYQEDFISTSLLFFLGRDFWQSFNIFYESVFTWTDRAEKVEIEWAESLSKQIGRNGKVHDLEEPFLSFWYDDQFNIDTSYRIPLLFMNTNWIEKGSRGISSPVKLSNDFTNILDILDTISMKKPENLSITIRKNTAALLGARFPYVSPSGRIKKGFHFNDAGYYDNTGGITALEIYNQCKKVQAEMQDSSSIFRQLEFHFIIIRNDNHDNDATEKLSDISELTVPLNTILQTRNATTSYFYDKMRSLVGKEDFHSIDIIHKDSKVIIPVSRYLTNIAIDAMKTNYCKESNRGEVLEILTQINKNKDQKIECNCN